MRRTLLIAGSLVLACLLATGTMASMDGFDLSWHVIGGGGGQSASPSYIVGGTIGQPDAGMLTGGSYTLGGGFWGGGAAQHRVYLPLVMRNYP